MSLDPRLWEALEAHGVTSAHLDMLLRLFETSHNGCCSWHIIRGTLAQCELRVNFASRPAEMRRVADAMVGP